VKIPFELLILLFFVSCIAAGCETSIATDNVVNKVAAKLPDSLPAKVIIESSEPLLDTALFWKQMNALCDSTNKRWPVKAPYPKAGALLPFHRIIAYYGNFYTPSMGVLGNVPESEMLADLDVEVRKWKKADTLTKVIPAIHYLAVTAQGQPGQDGKYRLRMPAKQLDKAVNMAKKVEGIAILDIQVGWSTVQSEVPKLERYLLLPNVHLGIDPEWSMKFGDKPGRVIGTMDAKDINFAVDYLAALVKKHDLPPKVLVIHRFTKGMLTNYRDIKTCPEVQIVVNMDGFGFAAKKVNTYRNFIAAQPVQFTGFKLFYKNDIKSKPYHLMTPAEVLRLRPKPVYIQYQ